MSRDKSLKSTGTLERHRNVLTRAERIAKLKELGRWDDAMRPMALPKVEHRKAAVGKKGKAKQAEAEGEAKPEAAKPAS